MKYRIEEQIGESGTSKFYIQYKEGKGFEAWLYDWRYIWQVRYSDRKDYDQDKRTIAFNTLEEAKQFLKDMDVAVKTKYHEV